MHGPIQEGVCCEQVSMSSTSIVIKCLSDTKSTNTPHGAITIGTLILQVIPASDAAVCIAQSVTKAAFAHSCFLQAAPVH